MAGNDPQVASPWANPHALSKEVSINPTVQPNHKSLLSQITNHKPLL